MASSDAYFERKAGFTLLAFGDDIAARALAKRGRMVAGLMGVSLFMVGN
jgi:hypothetical protein